MSAPRALIVVANYNGARFIGRTVESLLAQDEHDLGVIVVDNASTDGSIDVVQAINDDRLALRAFDEHVSVTSNWNRALDIAAESGAQYVALVHSDDTWRAEFLTRTMLALDHSGADFAIGNAVIIDGEDREVHRETFQRRQRRVSGPLNQSDREQLLAGMDVYPCSWLARRAALEGRRFDERFQRAPDWHFWLEAFDEPGCIIAVPNAVSCYRLHESNDTFAPATLRGMREDEVRIVAEAVRRRETRRSATRRARRMIDIRCLVRCAQVYARGERRLALALVNELVRAIGILGVARAAIGLAALPDTRAALRDRARRRRDIPA